MENTTNKTALKLELIIKQELHSKQLNFKKYRFLDYHHETLRNRKHRRVNMT